MIDLCSELIDPVRIDGGKTAHQIDVSGEFRPPRNARVLRIGNPGVDDLIISTAANESAHAEHDGKTE